jgi:hypothetical protein
LKTARRLDPNRPGRRGEVSGLLWMNRADGFGL